MLIVKVYVNENKIDEIYIHNKGERFDIEKDCYEYRIEKPYGYNKIPIFHIRNTGYQPLLRQAIRVMQDVGKNKKYVKYLEKAAKKREKNND